MSLLNQKSSLISTSSLKGMGDEKTVVQSRKCSYPASTHMLENKLRQKKKKKITGSDYLRVMAKMARGCTF